MLSRAAWTENAERSARRRALRLTLKVCERGFGPKAAPPPRRCGTLSAPARARPVPFCFHALAPVIETSPRPRLEAVPRRRAARSARAASWTRLSWKSSPKTDRGQVGLRLLAERRRLDRLLSHRFAPPRSRPWGREPRREAAAGCARRRPGRPRAPLGDPLATHPAGHLGALEDAGGVGAGADRAGRADVVRAVRDGAAAEVVALDRALEALTDRLRRDLDPLARLELLDRERVADLSPRAPRRGTRRASKRRRRRPS